MKKSILIILISLFVTLSLSSCFARDKQDDVDDLSNNEIGISSISPSIYGYEKQYSTLSNMLSMLTPMAISESGAYFYTLISKSGEYSLFYYDNALKTVLLVNNDPSNQCSKDDYKKCTGFNSKDTILTLDYYDSKLYYTTSYSDSSTDKSMYSVVEMSLDGTGRKTVLTVEQKTEDAFSINFHKGYLYYYNKNEIYQVNPSNWKQRIFKTFEEGYVKSIFFEDNHMIVNVQNYGFDGNKYRFATVMLDIESDTEELIFTNIESFIADSEKSFIYANDRIYYVNRITDENKQISELSGTVLKQGSRYVVTEIKHDRKDEDIYYLLTDENGNILDKFVKDKSDSHSAYGLNEEGLFIMRADRERNFTPIRYYFMFVPITDDKFGEIEEIYTIDVSNSSSNSITIDN